LVNIMTLVANNKVDDIEADHDAPASAPGPELRKHLGAIQAGNRLDREWMSDERFNEIAWFSDIVGSHLISAREAAFRRDRSLLGDHLRHAREGLVLALKTFNILPSDGRPE
jgi:hypothetical protein